MQLTDDPLAPDCTINWSELSGNWRQSPCGTQALEIESRKIYGNLIKKHFLSKIKIGSEMESGTCGAHLQ